MIRPFFLDPRFWLALVVWSLMLGFGAYVAGASDAKEKAAAEEQVRTASALAKQADADAKTLADERALRIQDREIHTTYQQEHASETAEKNRLILCLERGACRVRIPIVRAPGAAAPTADRPAAPGTEPEGHAELAPDDAIELVDLLTRGDEGIRKHAALVDLYEHARLKCNGPAPDADPENP